MKRVKPVRAAQPLDGDRAPAVPPAEMIRPVKTLIICLFAGVVHPRKSSVFFQPTALEPPHLIALHLLEKFNGRGHYSRARSRFLLVGDRLCAGFGIF